MGTETKDYGLGSPSRTLLHILVCASLMVGWDKGMCHVCVCVFYFFFPCFIGWVGF